MIDLLVVALDAVELVELDPQTMEPGERSRKDVITAKTRPPFRREPLCPPVGWDSPPCCVIDSEETPTRCRRPRTSEYDTAAEEILLRHPSVRHGEVGGTPCPPPACRLRRQRPPRGGRSGSRAPGTRRSGPRGRPRTAEGRRRGAAAALDEWERKDFAVLDRAACSDSSDSLPFPERHCPGRVPHR